MPKITSYSFSQWPVSDGEGVLDTGSRMKNSSRESVFGVLDFSITGSPALAVKQHSHFAFGRHHQIVTEQLATSKLARVSEMIVVVSVEICKQRWKWITQSSKVESVPGPLLSHCSGGSVHRSQSRQLMPRMPSVW